MRLLHRIDQRIGRLMTAQADIDNAVSVLLEVTTTVLQVVQDVQADLASKGSDTTKLDTAIPQLQAAEQALRAAVPVPTSTTSTPGTTTTGTTTGTGTPTGP